MCSQYHDHAGHGEAGLIWSTLQARLTLNLELWYEGLHHRGSTSTRHLLGVVSVSAPAQESSHLSGPHAEETRTRLLMITFSSNP